MLVCPHETKLSILETCMYTEGIVWWYYKLSLYYYKFKDSCIIKFYVLISLS